MFLSHIFHRGVNSWGKLKTSNNEENQKKVYPEKNTVPIFKCKKLFFAHFSHILKMGMIINIKEKYHFYEKLYIFKKYLVAGKGSKRRSTPQNLRYCVIMNKVYYIEL